MAVEELGFDSFTLPDRICCPEESDSQYPHNGSGDREFLDGVPFSRPIPSDTGDGSGHDRSALRVGISPWPDDFAACQIPFGREASAWTR